MPQSDAYRLNGGTVWALCLAMSCDTSFDCERFFSCIFCQKLGLLNLTPLFQKHFIQSHEQKKRTGLVMSLDCLEKQLRAFEVAFGRRQVFWRKYFLRVEQFFHLFSPFAINYYNSHHLRNCPKCVSAIIPQPLLGALVTSGLRQKYFNRVFWEYFSRKHGSWRIFFSRFVVLYLTHSCLLLEAWSSWTEFDKQRLAFADFWADKFFFLC